MRKEVGLGLQLQKRSGLMCVGALYIKPWFTNPLLKPRIHKIIGALQDFVG